MLAAALLFPLALCASTLATPTARQLSGPPNCHVGNVGSFMLVAFYNETGDAKLIVPGGNGDPNATVNYLGTAETVPVPAGRNYTMTNSGLHVITQSGAAVQFGANVTDNSFLPFISLQDGTSDDPAPIYCLDADGGEVPPLEVNGTPDEFFVCASSTSSQEMVVFNPIEAEAVGYQFATCKKVLLNILL
ncbi:hypothetical protein DENSPDRAFT_849904 [Dentipellis sp. KUC8613]|nr:hypothetical protein DENSPDRAFT_849904 [Dentipellis sp. KUC8613]